MNGMDSIFEFVYEKRSMKLATDMHLMLRINSGIFSSFVLFLFPISSPIFYFLSLCGLSEQFLGLRVYHLQHYCSFLGGLGWESSACDYIGLSVS